MQLKPSEIFYSQNSISSVFGGGDYEGTPIGETLDKLVNGSISVFHIPTITVTKKPGSEKWYTLDNRRLWVFHHLQRKQPDTLIPVNVRDYCDLGEFNRNKFTSKNGGREIRVKNPGGKWYKKIRPVIPIEPKCDVICVQPNSQTLANLRPESKEHVIDPTETLRKQMIERLRRIQRGEKLPIVPFHKWSRESQTRLESRAEHRTPLINISVNTNELKTENREETTKR
ncbi:hypothetical protein DPMN_033048 [Dreissena polymorpha]|uniref:Uncharacterized protein n=1 Tax=Dreissena polymorpha TaxID=45954 RepID=A0A9D4M4X7_DREPO|nr:hypothetical protein DPMN_033048 [Dreissena polymorpha]